MTNIDLILETLEELMPSSYCDDYLSEQLGIIPRQQVNAICNKLSSQGLILRTKTLCPHCRRRKLVSKLAATPEPSTRGRGIKESFKSRVVNRGFPGLRGIPDDLVEKGGGNYKGSSFPPYPPGGAESPTSLDVEHIRTEIVRIGRRLWQERKKLPAPRSITKTINMLREDDIIPSHPANMMVTICHLRNVFVYESVSLGSNEMAVASGAWAIVSDWWKEKSTG